MATNNTLFVVTSLKDGWNNIGDTDVSIERWTSTGPTYVSRNTKTDWGQDVLGGDIFPYNSLCPDGEYVYVVAASDSSGGWSLLKVSISTGEIAAEEKTQTWYNSFICTSGDYIYCFCNGTYLYKLNKSFEIIATASPNISGRDYGFCATDGTHVFIQYYTGSPSACKIEKRLCSDLSLVTTSLSGPATQMNLAVTDDYVYAIGGWEAYGLYRFDKSTLSGEWDLIPMDETDGYVYSNLFSSSVGYDDTYFWLHAATEEDESGNWDEYIEKRLLSNGTLVSRTEINSDYFASSVCATYIAGSGGGDGAATDTTHLIQLDDTDGYIVRAYSYDDSTMAGGNNFVFAWADDYDSDTGLPIDAYWRSKDMDFTETYPQMQGQLKTIDKIRLWYEDLDADVPITVYLSNDGGITWAEKTHTIGAGDGKTKVQDYHFMHSTSSTGLNFSVKVGCTSTTKRFRWTALEIDFFVRGKDFEV